MEPLVYNEALVARRSANEMLRATAWESFDELAALMQSKKLILLQIYPHITVEMGLVEALAGGKATELFFSKVLSILPDCNTAVELSHVKSLLTDFQRTKLFTAIPQKSRTSIESVVNAVYGMEKGQPPKTQTWKEAFQKNAFLKLANFCHSTGAEALHHRLEVPKHKNANNFAALMMNDLDKVGIFRWMLRTAEAQAFDAITHKVLENLGVAGMQVVAKDAANPDAGFTCSRKGGTKSTRKSASSSSKKKKAESDDDAEFMRIFD